jgi:RNA recognition motif-containing protein
MKLFVRNLSYKATSQDLRLLFEGYGYQVEDAKVIADSEDGRSRGFGFVTIAVDGDKAILDLHESEHMGRTLHIEEAREKVKNGGSRGRRARRGASSQEPEVSDGCSWDD